MDRDEPRGRSASPPGLILRQAPGSHETRVISQAAMLVDIPCPGVSIEQLRDRKDHLRAGALPVGSVEFVREAMRVAGITEPANLSYPEALQPFLLREVRQVRAGNVLGTWFVKPVVTKAFTGFVFDTMKAPESYDEHDREQFDAFMALAPDAMVWISEPVRFVSEWRYYVLGDQVVGRGRYDPDGADDAPVPDEQVLLAAVRSMSAAPGCPASYGIDLGVLETGETALVEVNDAWALGCYGRGVQPRDYLAVLAARWEQVRSMPATRRKSASNPS